MTPIAAPHAPAPAAASSATRANPWPFILTLPLLSACPNAAALNLASLYYKSLGYSNAFIGYTGALFVPFAAAFLWGPWLDRLGTKRTWHLALLGALGAAFAALAGATALRSAFAWPTLAAFSGVAILGGTAEMSMNGYLLHALDGRQQAAYSGVRVGAIRCGHVLTWGLLLKFCADFGTRRQDPIAGWILIFGILAATFTLAAGYHTVVLPRPPTDHAVPSAPQSGHYARAWHEFRALPGVGTIVAFYLCYRFGEGLMVRMTSPFLLDPPTRGGLGMSVATVAVTQGTVGMVAAIAGGILGGALVHRFGFRRTAVPLALCMTLPHLGYLWLAATPHPGPWAVNACVAIESLGYGLGFASMFAMTMLLAQGEYRSTVAAILVALWSIGWLIPTVVSGLIEERLGYRGFFLLSIVTALPGILLVARLPLRRLDAALAAAS